mgnify:CR=1 FL=1
MTVKLSIADKVKIIDDVITREIEYRNEFKWADKSIEDLQNAWVDVKHYINEFYKEIKDE